MKRVSGGRGVHFSIHSLSWGSEEAAKAPTSLPPLTSWAGCSFILWRAKKSG